MLGFAALLCHVRRQKNASLLSLYCTFIVCWVLQNHTLNLLANIPQNKSKVANIPVELQSEVIFLFWFVSTFHFARHRFINLIGNVTKDGSWRTADARAALYIILYHCLRTRTHSSQALHPSFHSFILCRAAGAGAYLIADRKTNSFTLTLTPTSNSNLSNLFVFGLREDTGATARKKIQNSGV